MHEHSLMQNFIKQILTAADKDKASEVSAISVRLGALSHMSKDHFIEHFNEVARDTIAEHARLDITEDQDPFADNALGIWIENIEVRVEA
jgi:hydrogenase nickel incorporation protein HypA/HybF